MGHVLPTPEGAREPTDDDAADADPFAAIRVDIAKLRGGVALVESMAGGYGDKAGRPDADWQPRRIGANPPAALNEIRTAAALTVYGACGVPPSLVTLPADGTGQREAWRRFLHGSVSPVARLVESELREKLDIPELTISFDALFAADIASKARAWRSLVGREEKMSDADARRFAGLE